MNYEPRDKIAITLNVNGRDHRIRVEPRKTLDDAVRSCLMFAVQAQGRRIRTVEGLGTPDNLHPLQRAFIEHHGLQCGFCTPGFLMLAANMLEQHPDIGDTEMLDVLSSNLCRCTGYQNIIKAVRAVRDGMQQGQVRAMTRT